MTRRYVQLGLAAMATAVLGIFVVAHAGSEPTRAVSDSEPDRTVSAIDLVNEVPFDHSIHAGKYGIPCLDCHVYADKSPVAGLPSGRKCMGCHKFVAKDDPMVARLAARVAAGQPLRWLRVFAVPDFIYFSHRMHVRKQVACSECHGDMAAKKTITQDQPFTMGRCLACHTDRGATRDCLGCHK
jgi:hypothetical protein